MDKALIIAGQRYRYFLRQDLVSASVGSCVTAGRPAAAKPHPHRSESMIHVAMTDLMNRRLTHESTRNWRDN
jgi:hypothetical protein